MADSIFKHWEETIDGLADDDFKKGVLTAIRKLKDEVYNLKVEIIKLDFFHKVNIAESGSRVLYEFSLVGFKPYWNCEIKLVTYYF